MYMLGEAPQVKNEAFEALQDVVQQGTFSKEEAVQVLCNVLDWDDRRASQAFDGLVAQNSVVEV